VVFLVAGKFIKESVIRCEFYFFPASFSHLFYVQVLDAQKMETGLRDFKISLWIIETVELVENRVWPICLFHKGNHLDTSIYETYSEAVSIFFIGKSFLEEIEDFDVMSFL
jgi:hypothetical protein